MLSGRIAWRQGNQTVRSRRHPVTPGVFPASPAPAASGQFPVKHGGRAARPRSPVLTPKDRAPPPFGDGWPALSGGQPEVLLIGGKACPHRVRPADPLKPGRDLAVIQVRVIAALAADELKRVGVAALSPALHDAGRPTPQARRAAVAGLTRRRERREILVITARRRVTGIARPA